MYHWLQGETSGCLSGCRMWLAGDDPGTRSFITGDADAVEKGGSSALSVTALERLSSTGAVSAEEERLADSTALRYNPDMGIIILGLGPGHPEQVTREAWQVLQEAREVYLRTTQHPTVEALPQHLQIRSFDHLYESLPTFAEVYEAIAAEVLSLGGSAEGVVYAVPGHPWVGEATTPLICQGAAERSIPVRIVQGLSFLEPLLAAVGVDLVDGMQIADAMLLAAAHHPLLLADRPAVVAQCYSRSLASDVKLTLLNGYPDEHPVTVVSGAGSAGQRLITLPLTELDRGDHFDHLTSLYLPPVQEPGSYSALQEVIAHLRSPGGCPWDQEQTHLSLRTELLEETYELLEALDAEDEGKMQEELGDLLLELILHIQIATEEGEFKLPDVIGGIVGKLVRRHPHVFGQQEVGGMEEVLSNWEEIKRAERGEQDGSSGLLQGLPSTLPALTQAQAYHKRLERVGFRHMEALNLSDQDMAVVAEMLAGVDSDQDGEARLGRRLLALAGLALQQSIDLESVLRAASAGLAEQFRSVSEERPAEDAG